MWKKSLSEKMARLFEIVGYFLFIPAIPLLLLSAVFIFPLLISVPVFGVGLILFSGYVKHSRATLSENKIIPLWLGTFFYNFLPLLFVAFQVYKYTGGTYRFDFQVLDYMPLILLIFWWIIAVCLSLTAIYDEIKHVNHG